MATVLMAISPEDITSASNGDIDDTIIMLIVIRILFDGSYEAMFNIMATPRDAITGALPLLVVTDAERGALFVYVLREMAIASLLPLAV